MPRVSARSGWLPVAPAGTDRGRRVARPGNGKAGAWLVEVAFSDLSPTQANRGSPDPLGLPRGTGDGHPAWGAQVRGYHGGFACRAGPAAPVGTVRADITCESSGKRAGSALLARVIHADDGRVGPHCRGSPTEGNVTCHR